MRRYATLLLATAAFLLPMAVTAQTATWKLAWEQPEVLATVQTYAFTLKVDAGAAAPITPTCTALAGTPGLLTTCTAPMPVLSQGVHTLVLTATSPFGSTSAPALNGAPPATAVSVRVIVVVQ
jgi:hypothetical protein